MKRLFLLIMATLCFVSTGCSRLKFSSSDEDEQKAPPRETPYWHQSKFYKAVVTYKSNNPHAWHRVWFKIEGREKDSFENNVDCYSDLQVGDSLLVEEVFSSVIHYYRLTKIIH